MRTTQLFQVIFLFPKLPVTTLPLERAVSSHQLVWFSASFTNPIRLWSTFKGTGEEQVTANREQSPVPPPGSKLCPRWSGQASPLSLEVTLVDSSLWNIYFSNIKAIPTVSSETNQSSIKARYPIRSHSRGGMYVFSSHGLRS